MRGIIWNCIRGVTWNLVDLKWVIQVQSVDLMEPTWNGIPTEVNRIESPSWEPRHGSGLIYTGTVPSPKDATKRGLPVWRCGLSSKWGIQPP